MIRVGKLYSDIMEKLKFEPGLDASNITIAIKEGGIVILGGEVKSYAEKLLAEKVLKKINGINGVADELKVVLVSENVKNDFDLIKAALNALEWAVFVPSERIKLVVERGHLTLSGQVEQYYQKMYAQKAVQDLMGVASVINNIIVKPEVDALDVKEQIIKEFERNARINASSIEVEVNGSAVTLKGLVTSFDEDKEARIAAWSVPGVAKVIDHLLISWE